MGTYKIKHFIASDGERFSQLYDIGDGGFPLFHPTAYVARAIRLKATHETQKVHLEAIKRLYEWATANQIDLVVRFQKRQFLRQQEVDDVTRFLTAARRGKSGETISTSKGNTFIAYAADYLRWLADEVIMDANSSDVRDALSVQHSRLKKKISRKTGSQSARAQETLTKHLPEPARTQLQALWEAPFTGVYRPADKGARLRNVVMLRTFFQTGMRHGELLSLKLRSLLESGGGQSARLQIERNHHDEYDTRVNQPVAKTHGRIVPITEELEQQLLEYISTYRAEIPNVGFSGEDFIFVNHRMGRHQGGPLTKSTFYQALSNLRRDFPALRPVHPHMLRHDWNYRFSQSADEKNLKPEREAEIRSVLMGWAPDSDMAQLYNKRHTQEKSIEFGLLVAGETKRKSPTMSDATKAHAAALALEVANSK